MNVFVVVCLRDWILWPRSTWNSLNYFRNAFCENSLQCWTARGPTTQRQAPKQAAYDCVGRANDQLESVPKAKIALINNVYQSNTLSLKHVMNSTTFWPIRESGGMLRIALPIKSSSIALRLFSDWPIIFVRCINFQSTDFWCYQYLSNSSL